MQTKEENTTKPISASARACELVKNLGEAVTEHLFDIDDDYEYEADEYGFYSASIKCSFYFEYGNSGCDVFCSVLWGSDVHIECELEGSEGIHEKVYKSLERIEQCVNKYLDENLDTDELLDAIRENYVDSFYDEWNEHGFRDEADYLH